MCEIYGFCGSVPTKLNNYTDEFWMHSRIHRDGFGYYLADKDELYVNPKSAMEYIDKLKQKNFTSNLALCHIRFKTHGPATAANCHPFAKTDCHGVKWTLIHNGYISDDPLTSAVETYQNGETDSERILLCIIETINSFYEHSYFENYKEQLQFLYAKIEQILINLADLGKTNLIFTDNRTNNMYVFMNSPRTLYYLETPEGYHFSTTPLSKETWVAVPPYKLHVFNSGQLVG